LLAQVDSFDACNKVSVRNRKISASIVVLPTRYLTRTNMLDPGFWNV
jgi:hypothetical protein